MCNTLASTMFLRLFKDLLEQGQVVMDARNDKTRNFMLKHSLAFEDLWEILSDLQPKEILRGPTPDRNRTPGDVMEFIHPWMNLTLYVKIKVVSMKDGNSGAVLSVHEDEVRYYG